MLTKITTQNADGTYRFVDAIKDVPIETIAAYIHRLKSINEDFALLSNLKMKELRNDRR